MPSKNRKRKNATARKTRPACPRPDMEIAVRQDQNNNLTAQACAVRKDIAEFSSQVKRPEFDEIVLTHYLTPYLLHKEFEQRPSSTREAAKIISGVIGQLKKFLMKEGSAMFRNGELSACGSVPENTKVGKPDEFDYQYLITIGRYTAARKVHPRTRPRQGDTSLKLGTKSFYELRTIGENGNRTVLQADVTQDLFMDNICRAVSKFNIEYTVKKAGPAVKLVFKHPEIEYNVRVDLTLGIEAKVLDVFKEGELTPLGVKLLHISKLQCHFVSSTDYWKICFLRTEQSIMEAPSLYQVGNEKLKCYRIIKSLRDEQDVKDLYGDGILQSYPLKVTFMDLALTDAKEGREWTEQDVGRNVNRVLREVESRGQRHKICSLFVKDEEVMGESDRSYLESTRILDELTRLHDTYLREKSVLAYTCMLLIGALAFIVHMFEYMNVQLNSPLNVTNVKWSNQKCDVEANLHRYMCLSNLSRDISYGAYNLTLLLYILECVCVLVYIFQMVNEKSKIKGLHDLSSNGVFFNITLFVLLFKPLIPFIKLGFCNEEEEVDLRHAMYEVHMTTVFPVLHALMRLSMKAVISIALPFKTLIIMESFFQQGELGSDYPLVGDIQDYIAEVPYKQSKHWKKCYLAILVLSLFLFVVMCFLYIYFWNEKYDESFLFDRSGHFVRSLIISTFMPQYIGFIVASAGDVLTLTYLFLYAFMGFSLPYSVAFLLLPLIFMLLCILVCSLYTAISLHLILVLISIFLQVIEEANISRHQYKILSKFPAYWSRYKWLIMISCYYMMWGAHYYLALFAHYLKSNHVFIAVYMSYLIGLVILASCIILGLSLWMCTRSEAFRKYTVRLLGIKFRKYVDELKSNIWSVFITATIILLFLMSLGGTISIISQ